MRRRFRNLRANWYYLKRPMVNFLPSLTLLVVITCLGGWAFHSLYEADDGTGLSLPRALFITYCLIFMEHLLPFPDQWLLQIFYVVLPPLGLMVILDGLARFGYHVLRREESGGEWMSALARTYENHVVLCGLGKVGLRILQQLIQLGEDVVVLEKNPANENVAYAKKQGVPVLFGDGRQAGIMDDLNIAAAKSLITATDDDLANLEMVLDAHKIKPGIRVVMRMFDQELAAKIRESFGIHLAFSTSAQAAPLFATSSSDRSIINSFYVGEKLLVVARLEVGGQSQFVGQRIGDLCSSQPVFVLSLERGGQETHYPPPETALQIGDQLVVQMEPAILNVLHKLNADESPRS